MLLVNFVNPVNSENNLHAFVSYQATTVIFIIVYFALCYCFTFRKVVLLLFKKVLLLLSIQKLKKQLY